MKRILIVCLLGMGLLLPSTTVTAKEFSHKESAKRIIDVMLEGHVLLATSDATTGTLVSCYIWNGSKSLVLQQSLSGYSDDVDVSGLSSGWYTVQIFTTLTGYSENVYIN